MIMGKKGVAPLVVLLIFVLIIAFVIGGTGLLQIFDAREVETFDFVIDGQSWKAESNIPAPAGSVEADTEHTFGEGEANFYVFLVQDQVGTSGTWKVWTPKVTESEYYVLKYRSVMIRAQGGDPYYPYHQQGASASFMIYAEYLDGREKLVAQSSVGSNSNLNNNILNLNYGDLKFVNSGGGWDFSLKACELCAYEFLGSLPSGVFERFRLQLVVGGWSDPGVRTVGEAEATILPLELQPPTTPPSVTEPNFFVRFFNSIISFFKNLFG